jgi:hypothetical protein
MCPGLDSASKNEYQANPGGKGGRCLRLATYHLHVPMSRNLGALTSWNPAGLFRPVMGQLYLYLYLTDLSMSDCWHSCHLRQKGNGLLCGSFFFVALKLATAERQVSPSPPLLSSLSSPLCDCYSKFNTFFCGDWKAGRLTELLCCAGLRVSRYLRFRTHWGLRNSGRCW